MANLFHVNWLPKLLPGKAFQSLSKTGILSARTLSFAPTRPLKASSEREVNNSVKAAADEVEKKAATTREKIEGVTADQVIDKGAKATEKAMDTAQESGEKAKRTVQEAWNSAKETAEKVKETVREKAEDAKDSVIDSIEKAKRAVNDS
ncbi:hypothetical protein KSP39_PZI004288 [Platanthera zijinensis]|uniref:Late embryogenesis abundant protein n=1 Tax=Platanthera zijinensis TaxID=2320716 RepID=A0AAP0BU94_9ASPA